MKHPLLYSLLILIIILLLIDKCNRKPKPDENKPFKTAYIQGKDSIRIDTIRIASSGVNPAPDTVYLPSDTLFLPSPDDSLRKYTLTENDSTGGTTVNATVQGHLLNYDIERTCFNEYHSRVDTLKEYYTAPARRLVSVGVFSGVMANQFTYGVNVSYQDKLKRSYALNVDPVNRGGFVSIGFPIKLRR